jgi:hypothetical protein
MDFSTKYMSLHIRHVIFKFQNRENLQEREEEKKSKKKIEGGDNPRDWMVQLSA